MLHAGRPTVVTVGVGAAPLAARAGAPAGVEVAKPLPLEQAQAGHRVIAD